MFINKYSLLNAHRGEIVSENAPLFSLQYYFLSGDEDMLENIIQYVFLNKVDGVDGLYNQFPFRTNNKDDYTSPDQLIAFVGALYAKGYVKKIEEIRSYLAKHAFTYDNLQPNTINKDRLIQPATLWFIAICSGRWWYYPLLTAALIWSCVDNAGESSGKLKAWTMMRTLGMDNMLKLCGKILAGFSTWAEVFATYYQEPSHPNRILSNEYS